MAMKVVTYTADPRVDAYINALPSWQQAICRDVRELVHSAAPEVAETVKRAGQPYFVLQGNICALLAAKDHVNVFVYDGGIVPDPAGIITAGHGNKTARTVAVRQGGAVNSAALTDMFRQIIANNRAGGWRKLKPPGWPLIAHSYDAAAQVAGPHPARPGQPHAELPDFGPLVAVNVLPGWTRPGRSGRCPVTALDSGRPARPVAVHEDGIS